MEIPSGFPEVLRWGLPAKLHPDDLAFLADPALLPLWQALAAHVPAMARRGWDPPSAAVHLMGSVFDPLVMGYDFHGTTPRRVRDGLNMAERRNAASLASELAERLAKIEAGFFPPDGVLDAVSLLRLPASVRRHIPSYFREIRMAEVLRRLAAELETPPDLSQVAGLASQKASWRGFIREVQQHLELNDFILRERDAVALVARLAANAGKQAPSREAVRDALRPLA